MIRARPHIAAMQGYRLADLGPDGATSLAQNESAFPPSPRAIDAGRRALDQGALYPDPDWHTLRDQIAAVFSVKRDMILCGAGSMELIGCLIRAYIGPGDVVLGSKYGYLYVSTATQLSGGTYLTAPEPDFRVSVDDILARCQPPPKIVFLCNPGNPTGTAIPNSEILRLRREMPEESLLVVDQAYGEFDDQDPSALFDLVGEGQSVVTRTFSKAYALAGARVGWGVFPPEIVSELRKILNPNNISLAGQAMATAAMADQDYLEFVIRETETIRTRFTNRLRSAGFTVPDSATNFVLVLFKDRMAAECAEAELRQNGLIPRGMAGYGLSHALRITIGSAEIMDRAATILETLSGERR